jgi:hypothetical protein
LILASIDIYIFIAKSFSQSQNPSEEEKENIVKEIKW